MCDVRSGALDRSLSFIIAMKSTILSFSPYVIDGFVRFIVAFVTVVVVIVTHITRSRSSGRSVKHNDDDDGHARLFRGLNIILSRRILRVRPGNVRRKTMNTGIPDPVARAKSNVRSSLLTFCQFPSGRLANVGDDAFSADATRCTESAFGATRRNVNNVFMRVSYAGDISRYKIESSWLWRVRFFVCLLAHDAIVCKSRMQVIGRRLNVVINSHVTTSTNIN